MIIGNNGFKSKACPESSRVSSIIELYRGGCEYRIRYPSPIIGPN